MQEHVNTVPLSRLTDSEANVRKGALDENQVRSLAATIAAHGLLYPMLVTEVAPKGRSKKCGYAVAAGRRRFAALRLLRDEGKIDADHDVPVRIVADENAVELSAVENMHEPMHPVDEYEAFRRMVDEGAGVETVAARFGVSVAVVQRRLKLANVAPTLIALYREGDMSLEQLMALTVPEKLVRALTAQRTAALQAMLIENHHVALAALAFTLVTDLAPEVYYRCKSGVEVSTKSAAYAMHAADPSVEQSGAWQQINTARAAWGERLPGEPDALWQCLLKLFQEELIALLAHCTALTVDGIQSRVGEHATDALAQAVNLDMADWWSATPDAYLSRVRKADVLQAVSEAVSPAEAVPLASMKNGPMVEAAGRLMEGKRWVPPILRQHAA
ncbi:LysR family transcriptional regulator (plasmid) [Ralstonia solanacearum]|nr:LysR family transcriptional regulator [Ralstonia solanacearum]